MDALTIVLLTVAIALLAGALAWYGPRRRHWQTRPGGDERRQEAAHPDHMSEPTDIDDESSDDKR